MTFRWLFLFIGSPTKRYFVLFYRLSYNLERVDSSHSYLVVKLLLFFHPLSWGPLHHHSYHSFLRSLEGLHCVLLATPVSFLFSQERLPFFIFQFEILWTQQTSGVSFFLFHILLIIIFCSGSFYPCPSCHDHLRFLFPVVWLFYDFGLIFVLL